MDLKIRSLERLGKGPKYWAAIRQADLFYRYAVPLGPPSLFDAICAGCNKPGLKWSNCCYCQDCHGGYCDMETHDQNEIDTIGMINSMGKLVTDRAASCNGP